MPASRSETRARLRRARRTVPAWRRHQAAFELIGRARRLPVWRRARRIAIYLPADGEIDVRPLAREALARGARLYLPVLARHGLRFRRWHPGQGLRRNRFGIAEPPHRAVECPARRLDVVIMPLVAFDSAGNRLGMGGGFYDRTFASLQHRRRRPRLIGAAYALQRLPAVSAEPWDVPLDAVLTERRVWSIRQHAPIRGAPWPTG